MTITSIECRTRTEITHGKITVTSCDGRQTDFTPSEYYRGTAHQSPPAVIHERRPHALKNARAANEAYKP